MVTANQPHVTKRPVQVRCCSQPTGFRSSLWRIQRRKNESQRKGVQKTCSHQTCACDGGPSCQTRRVFAPAIRTARNKTNTENIVLCATAQSKGLAAHRV